MAAHIVLEESGEKYEPIRLDLAKGEQRSEAYLKLNPGGVVPTLIQGVTQEVSCRAEPPDLSDLIEVVYGASPIRPDQL